MLRSRTNSFLVIQFWPDEEAYQSARNTPFHPVLTMMLTKLTSSYGKLGIFSFPPTADRQWHEVDAASLVRCGKDSKLGDS